MSPQDFIAYWLHFNPPKLWHLCLPLLEYLVFEYLLPSGMWAAGEREDTCCAQLLSGLSMSIREDIQWCAESILQMAPALVKLSFVSCSPVHSPFASVCYLLGYLVFIFCRKLLDTEDELSDIQSDSVPLEVRDWLASTFTREMGIVKRRPEEKPKFRSIVHAVQAGIFVERWELYFLITASTAFNHSVCRWRSLKWWDEPEANLWAKI